MSGTDTSFIFPSAVGWSGSLDEATQIARLKKKPYAVYVATKEEFKTVGENTDTIKQFATANGNTLPTTIFELPKIIDQFRSMGVIEFVKIANTKENRELVEKYAGANGMIVVIAPDGGKIGSWTVIGGNMNNIVAGARTILEVWQHQQDFPAK